MTTAEQPPPEGDKQPPQATSVNNTKDGAGDAEVEGDDATDQ